MQKIQTEKSDPWKGHPCIVAIVGFEPTGQSRKCRRSTARPCEFPLKCADAFDDRSSSHGFCVVVVICGLGYMKDHSSNMSCDDLTSERSGNTGTTPPDPRSQCATLALCQSLGRAVHHSMAAAGRWRYKLGDEI